uniref:Ribosomal protein uS12 methylthiotransferase RimO n=1 Tax=Hydrogenovibrio crunogenus (strain DSM 25203 / XCL-2) TaxID=317025 RepID=RIMO_HYDCU|nr:RecName: Full=Ribosomal protein uS12 methylthiotransferase RimO; Short=uS12 MTTase; Short=uS12 methylthiotransferase; AltName: Full=Ribosomal protein uS12 (aspartate-C(3))-methylthiotransferase; AltName: Full=Ribosome maturation factor RimO [Hydrogenovibrio crunogenus XCL-2]
MSQQQPTVGIVSLGCPKATVDSERILTQLKAEGYHLTNSYEEADAVIVNTCGFIDSAVQESLDTIGEALDENGRVIVTGCLGAKDGVIEKVHPSVLAVSGPAAYEEVLTAVHEAIAPPKHDPFVDLVPPQGIKLTPKHFAYLKISEGCNHRCTFCIIPSMRGNLVSRPVSDVVAEARRLKEAGVKELLVVSQDTAAYGVDVKYKTEFADGRPTKTSMFGLAEALSELGIWVRLHYVYPYPNVEDVIPLMAEGKLLPYLDMPLQHADPDILKAMKRPGNVDKTLERIKKWREQVPDLTIRSTFIVGFPGETEAQFQNLLDFIEEAQLDRVGCFQYSPVEGAVANDLAEPVPDEVKQERFDRFMQLQQQISANKMQAKIGKTIQVLVDEVDEEGAIARSKADAPEIDGMVFIPEGHHLNPGDFVEVEVFAADEYDLWATPVGEFVPQETSYVELG